MVVTEDIQSTVIADKLEVTMIRRQPPVLDYDYSDAAQPHRQSPWRLFTPVAGIAIDSDLHLPAGDDDS